MLKYYFKLKPYNLKSACALYLVIITLANWVWSLGGEFSHDKDDGK